MTEINFREKAKELLMNTFAWKTHLSMKRWLAILLWIVTFWVGIIAMVFFGLFCVFIFLASIAEVPAKFLHGVLRSEGEHVHKATSVVVYIFAWPIVFLCYVYVTFVEIMLHIMFALTHCVMWCWCLGGFQFNPFAF